MGVLASRRLTAPGERAAPLHRPGSAVHTIAARALTRYLRGVARHGTIRSLDRDARPLDTAAVGSALATPRSDDRPRLVVYWGADALAVALLPFLEGAFLRSARAVTFLFDETFGGHVCAALADELRSRYVLLERSERPERFEQLRGVMRRGGSYAFAIDGGGPYSEVGSGVATLARALKAFIVPIAAVAHPALPFPHRSRISFPLPRCRTTVAIGDPIDGLTGDRQRIVTEIKAALESLGRMVRRTPG
jgi:lysophospholipid acyltransferase (LPLAT)-like uncharacterized protein